MTVPRLAVGFHPDRPVGEVADLAADAERLGYPSVWIADSQSIFRDVYAALTLAAERTTRIALGTGVTNPVTRHPAVIASAIGSVAEHAAGRDVLLGLGTGETAVESIGRKRATIARMEDTARTIRALHAGEPVTYEGAELAQAWSVGPVPIVFASSGPRSLRAAGRSADGVYLKLGVHPAVLRYAMENVDAGRAEATHRSDGFRVQAMVPVSVDDDAAAARDEVRGFAAAIARAAVRAIPSEDLPGGLGEEIAELERVSSAARERQSYVAWLHSPEYARLIPDSIVEAFAIAGTASDVADRIVALGEAGVTEVIAPLTMPDPGGPLRRIGSDVLPRLAESGR